MAVAAKQFYKRKQCNKDIQNKGIPGYVKHALSATLWCSSTSLSIDCDWLKQWGGCGAAAPVSV